MPCSCVTSAGGADEHAGKDEAGAGFHQAASLLHTAVAAGEGHAPHQHEARAQETAGGDPGDEVSAQNVVPVFAELNNLQEIIVLCKKKPKKTKNPLLSINMSLVV